MNLRRLRTFVAVADAGGFSRAMSRLHVSQPAASRQIDALQSELGVRLFEKSGRGLRLTADGEDLLLRSRALLAEAEKLEERAKALKAGRGGVLRLGATPQMIENVLAGFLADYRQLHPDVDVRLVEDGGAQLPERLAHGEVQLAIIPSGDPRFPGRLLIPNYLMAVLPRAHRLARRGTLEVAELAGERILAGRGFASRGWFEAACELAHFKPNVVFETGGPHTLVALVRSGYGIAMLPSNAVMRDAAVRFVPLVHATRALGRWTQVAWDPQRYLPRYAEEFVDALCRRCAFDFPGRALVRRAPPLPRPQES